MKSWREDINYLKFKAYCVENEIDMGDKINQLIRKFLIDNKVKVKE